MRATSTKLRKIHREDGIRLYKIGSCYISIYSPKGKKYLTNDSEVTGMSPDDLERGYWKKWFKGITPKHINDYISKHYK